MSSGVVRGWYNELLVHEGKAQRVIISTGGICFQNGQTWPIYPPEEKTLEIPTDDGWYTVLLRLEPFKVTNRGESWKGFRVRPEVLPGLSWDYDSDKEPLAAVYREGDRIRIEDRRRFLTGVE